MGLTRYARLAAFIILIIVTIVGVVSFLRADPTQELDFWRSQFGLLPWVFLIACVDVALEGVAWMWVYTRLGVRAWDSHGLRAYLAGRAGLILPAQLGRLIRPDAMARMGRGSMKDCMKAEGATFVLDATSVVALMAGIAGYVIHPALAPVAVVAVVGTLLLLGNRVARMFAGALLPPGFWWSWQTFAIVAVQMFGWGVHGAGMYILVRNLPGDATLHATIFATSFSAVAGAGTGLPGGIGATEGLLGLSLKFMQVEGWPIAVAAFRLLSFWIWIPLGWIALVLTGRGVLRRIGPSPAQLEALEEVEITTRPVRPATAVDCEPVANER